MNTVTLLEFELKVLREYDESTDNSREVGLEHNIVYDYDGFR